MSRPVQALVLQGVQVGRQALDGKVEDRPGVQSPLGVDNWMAS